MAADTVTSRTIIDGPRNVVMSFTNVSGGDGEAAVTKVDVSALSGSPATVSIRRVRYSVSGMVLTILEDADTDVRVLDLQGDGILDFSEFGGIPNSKAAGYTGDLKFTTTGHTANDSYSVILELTKQ